MNPQQQPITRLGLSLSVILIGSFMAPFLMYSSTLAIPTIAHHMHLDAELISWFSLLNMLGSALFVLPAGKLSDIYGRRRVFCLGVALAAFACLLSGFAQNSLILLIGRFLQGMGGAFTFGCSVTLVSSIPPKKYKAKAMGVYLAVCYLGLVAGPLIGSVILEHLHWRWVFHIPAIILSITSIVGFAFINWERYGDSETRLRFLDTGLYMASLIMLAFAVFRTHELFGQGLLACGLISFSYFCWFQNQRRDPLLQTKLFSKNLTFATLGLTHFFYYCAIMATSVTITLYLQYIKGLDATTTGLILISQALLTAIVAPLSGWLGDRVRVRYLLIAGVLFITLSMLSLSTMDFDTPVSTIIIALAITGIGVAIADTQLFDSALGSVDEKLLGSASATLSGLRSMGGLVGIGVMSFLMGHHLGKQELIPSLYPELLLVLKQFYMFSSIITVLSLCCLSIGIWLGDYRKKSFRAGKPLF